MTWRIRDFSKLDCKLIDEAWSVFTDSTPTAGGKRILRLETIATHSGKIINKRVYPGQHVKDAAKSFFKNEDGANFDKPFLKNHNPHSEPIGRVVKADFKQTATGKRFLNDFLKPLEDGSGFTKITSHIMDEDAIEKFLDGRYATVSVGGGTDGAYCSTCTTKQGKLHPMWAPIKNSDGEEHRCEHVPGTLYDGSMCHLITGKLKYNEVSQVNIPADDNAVHAMKEIITNDSAQGDSLFNFMEDSEDIDLGLSPSCFSIVDADGNILNGLTEDTYKSTKTISVPKEGTEDVRDSEELSDEEFAKAHILTHFSDLGMLTLSEAQEEEVKKLKDAKLTDDQSRSLKEPFVIHPSIPFKVFDKAHYDSFVQMINDGDLDLDRERFVDAMRKQAQSENLTLDSEVTTMEKEALVKALNDAQQKVETLEAEAKGNATKISDLEAKLSSSEEKVTSLSDSLHTDRVTKIIELRQELGYHDTKELADEDKQEEAMKALTDKYVAKESSVISDMLEDLLAQKQAGGFASANGVQDSVENPLEDDESEGDSSEGKSDKEVSDSQEEENQSVKSPW